MSIVYELRRVLRRRIAAKRTRLARVAAGHCPRCNEPDTGGKRCAACRKVEAAKKRERYARKRAGRCETMT